MRYADMALYRAKNEGRNRACIYDAAMDADLSKRKLIEQELREAIEQRRARGAVPADRQRQRREGGRRRGAGALDASATRADIAGRVHPDRRAFRPDHRARRLRAAPRLHSTARPGRA